jgi:hypothetical protein
VSVDATTYPTVEYNDRYNDVESSPLGSKNSADEQDDLNGIPERLCNVCKVRQVGCL